MENFNIFEYEQMIGDLIHDTFYVGLTKRGKIKGIRQFSEVIVRKILNIGSDTHFTLGKAEHMEQFKKLSDDRKVYLKASIEKIRPLGNDGTHTQHTEEFSDAELNQVKDGLFDLYAYLFIDYFLKYPIELLSPQGVLPDFSLLPPIIRFKTLKYFYDKDANLQIANRYCLSIIKTYGKKQALEWLELEKSKLLSMPYPTNEEIREYYIKTGLKVSPNKILVNLQLENYNNVYDLLIDKIEDDRTSMNESGKMYSQFEEAKKYYIKNRSKNSNKELNDLHEIMDFVYLGRKENNSY
ncbi:hypothetical protein GMC29_08405 [Streptococcus salivarius]|jgi:hypothetical protein|uniref:hypothetical protein n=1 Tax=Streptococcus salivarius TaxID=1304 RepID=UPI0012BCA9F1|nr:hypothetical protein [Streptococcus salivarius]MDB8602606.1 hypothetical protein [Streptococcus salivarius]MDB8612493.1 hypothetical protein [Streptococcus salivarius]MEE0585610.1 hypothetical protein [Streptococcus salivarius]MTR26344.1 hypothetical protein [Streptococcus salivarius]